MVFTDKQNRPIDIKMHDENGNPVVIGESPLTAHPAVRRQELMRHVARYYNGKVPEHLYPVLENIHAEEMELMKNATRKVENKNTESLRLRSNDTIQVARSKDIGVEHDSLGISGMVQSDSNWFVNEGFKIERFHHEKK